MKKYMTVYFSFVARGREGFFRRPVTRLRKSKCRHCSLLWRHLYEAPFRGPSRVDADGDGSADGDRAYITVTVPAVPWKLCGSVSDFPATLGTPQDPAETTHRAFAA